MVTTLKVDLPNNIEARVAIYDRTGVVEAVEIASPMLCVKLLLQVITHGTLETGLESHLSPRHMINELPEVSFPSTFRPPSGFVVSF